MNTIVRTYLIESARKRVNQTVTYQKLSDDCQLGFNMRESPIDRKLIGKILEEISKFEYKNKRTLLSALVIRAGDKYEGDGFYKLGEQLGFGKWEKLKKEGIFEVEHIRNSIDYWSDNSKYLANKDVQSTV